jgi:hypothetical protein
MMKELWEDPDYADKMRASRQSEEYRKKQSKNQKGKTHTVETRAKLSKISNKRWGDSKFRENHANAMEKVVTTPEFKEKQSELGKQRWSDPEYKQKMIDIQKIAHNDPDYLKKRSEISKKMWEDPKYRKLQSDIQYELNNNPERKEYFVKRMKELWLDPEHCKKMSDIRTGEKNPRWNNGSSYHGYCFKFKKVQPRVRMFFNDTCVECGKTKEEEGRELSVHHVYSNKNVCCDEDERKFMVPLCMSCHNKIPRYSVNTTPERLKLIHFYEERYATLIKEKYGGKCYYTEEEMDIIQEELETLN